MAPSPFDARRECDVTDVVAGVGIACCVLFGTLALLDQQFGTAFWPSSAEYGVSLFAYLSMYWAFLTRLTDRQRAISVGLVSLAIVTMVVAAYTNPEGVLLPVALVSLVVGGVVGLKGVVESFGTSRSTGH